MKIRYNKVVNAHNIINIRYNKIHLNISKIDINILTGTLDE